jgi:hypothetical protein
MTSWAERVVAESEIKAIKNRAMVVRGFFMRGLLQLRSDRSYRAKRTSSFIAVPPASP